MAELIGALLLVLGLAMLLGRFLGEVSVGQWRRIARFAREERFMVFAVCVVIVGGVVMAVNAKADLAGSAGWRDNFTRLQDVTELAIGDVVDVACWEDENDPNHDWSAWAPPWHRWEAQVLEIEAPGVYRLNVFPDLMEGKTSFEEFWFADLFFSVLPHVQLKDFGHTWPDIGPDVGHLYLRFADGRWSVDANTRIRHRGLCGNRAFDVMVGEELRVEWSTAGGRYEGVVETFGVPEFCTSRRWQPFFCDLEDIKVRSYCAFLSEDDGRWEERIEELIRHLERGWLEGNSVETVTGLFLDALVKLESYCADNLVASGGAIAASSAGPVCTQAALMAEDPPTLAAQCEILEDLIGVNQASSTRMAIFAPEYQRLGCPCSEDEDGSGVPDFFELPKRWECPTVAWMPETTEHETYLIPVPEPSRLAMLAAGLAMLAMLARRRARG